MIRKTTAAALVLAAVPATLALALFAGTAQADDTPWGRGVTTTSDDTPWGRGITLPALPNDDTPWDDDTPWG
jgi:hypothetical protein